MELLKTILVVLQIISAIGVIALVLIQQGKGADMGAAFGGGASGTLFGPVGMLVAVPTYTAIKVVLQEFLAANKIVRSLTKDF